MCSCMIQVQSWVSEFHFLLIFLLMGKNIRTKLLHQSTTAKFCIRCLELSVLVLLLLLLVLRHLLADLLRSVEDAHGRLVADEALFVLRVVLKH